MRGRTLAVLVVLAGVLGAWVCRPGPVALLPRSGMQSWPSSMRRYSISTLRDLSPCSAVDVIVDQARLRQSRRLWFDVNVLISLDPLDLLNLKSDDSQFLDVWYGDYWQFGLHQLLRSPGLLPGGRC